MKKAQRKPMSVRLDPEIESRLDEVCQRLGISKHSFALLALEAGVEAAEENEYRLVLPLKFQPTHIAVKAAPPHNLEESSSRFQNQKKRNAA